MIIRYHSLETYYLNRRLELLQRLDDYAEQTLHDEDFEMNDLNLVIKTWIQLRSATSVNLLR